LFIQSIGIKIIVNVKLMIMLILVTVITIVNVKRQILLQKKYTIRIVDKTDGMC